MFGASLFSKATKRQLSRDKRKYVFYLYGFGLLNARGVFVTVNRFSKGSYGKCAYILRWLIKLAFSSTAYVFGSCFRTLAVIFVSDTSGVKLWL